MSRRVSVRAVVMLEGKLLCVRLKSGPDATLGKFWCLPGGGLDDNEGLLAGLDREMLEETGIAPQIGGLLYVQQFILAGNDNLEFFFHVINAQDYQHIDLSKTTHGHVEIAEIAFVDPAAAFILPKFLSTEPLAQHLAAQTTPKIFSYKP